MNLFSLPDTAPAPHALHARALPQPDLPTARIQGSRRLRIWELDPSLHCPVLGICMSIDALRRLVVKHYAGPCVVSDYDVHCVVVQACRARQPLIELVQKELDRSHHLQIKQFHLAKSGEAVAALWRAGIEGGEFHGSLAGALWAALTHARTDDALRTIICQDVHMIQHSIGDQSRRDSKALADAQKTNAELAAEIGSVRAKLHRQQAQSVHDLHTLQQQLADAAADRIGAESQINALTMQIELLRDSVSELDTREKLKTRADDLAEQNSRLKQQLAQVSSKRVDPNESAAAAEMETMGLGAPPLAIPPRSINLHKKSVLCVGGRSGTVASYRQAVERAGGRFVHHDGGIEHNHHRLDANLAAADCVVCQTGSISHTAYWLVKDYCKKTGKTCLYLDKPGVTSFVEGLGALPFEDAPPAPNARSAAPGTPPPTNTPFQHQADHA